MGINKRYMVFAILLSLSLIFTSCKNSVNENPKSRETTVSINDNNNSYSENDDGLQQPTPLPEENTGPQNINTGEQNFTGDCESQKNADETKENGADGETPGAAITPKEILIINGLVRVQDVDPDIVVELKYATEDNFTGMKIYPNEICVLREATALKLANANKELMKMGYRIKVWDAYRPVYVQKMLWEIVPDSRYVANPYKGGSKHNRGTAVDVTLVDMEGNELEMPSGFDDFSGKGSRSNNNMSENARKNMELLTEVMVRNGFTTISTEWWHYNDSDSDKYDIIDVNLEEFVKNDAAVNSQDAKAMLCFTAIENMADITRESRQVIFVCTDSMETSSAEVYTFEKQNGQWKQVFEPMKAVIGSNGFSYGKVEGDKKSPIGAFPIYRCFGRQENPGTRLAYTQFGEGDYWVDDTNSLYYNTYQKGPAGRRWKSAEDLYGIGDPYKYFIVIEYNTVNPVAGKGSAIFMHIWRDENSPTAGCTAVSEENLLKIMKWLDPSMKPLILQFPVQHIQQMLKL